MLDVLDGHVLDVEANVVAGNSLWQGLVVHLDRLDLSGEADGGEGDDHAGLDHSSLDTTDGHCANATNLVNILRGLSVGLLGGMMESRASRRVIPLALPSFLSTFHPLYQVMLVEASIMLSPCHPEMGTKATAAGL